MLRRALPALVVLVTGLSSTMVPATAAEVLTGTPTSAVAAGPLAPVSAGAARATVARRAKVTVRVSATRVTAGDKVRFSGKVRTSAKRVVLQRRVAQGWKRVARTRVRGGTAYKLRTRVPQGEHQLRVRALRSGKKRALTSPVVRVEGLSPTGAPPADPTAGTELAQVRALVLRQTNELRAAHGLPPVKPMTKLDGVAQRWSEQMAATGRFEHNPQFADQYPQGWTRAGENIAFGYTPDRVVQAWTDSPGHKANMLGDYTHLGIGFARNAQGHGYYTQNFGRY